MTKRITTRIDDATHQRIQMAAKEQSVDMSAIVCLALADYFNGSEVLSAKLDAIRRAMDNHQETLTKRLELQVVQLGELLAMVIGEQTNSKSLPPHSKTDKPSDPRPDVNSRWDQVNNLNQ